MYALDSNSVIDVFRGRGGVGRRLLETPPSQLALPAIALYELEVGIARASASARRRSELEEFLAPVLILPFGENEAKVAAKIRTDLERAGTPIGPLDTLIAATALHHGATLVTHNVGEFSRVPGLAVEDWY